MLVFALAVLLLILPCSSLLYQVSRATSKTDLEKSILLRFPLVTKLDEQVDLIGLYLPALLKKGTANDEVDTFVAKDSNNRIVGALHITKMSLFIQDLTVDERLRRLGIATSLILHAFSEARKGKILDTDTTPVVSLLVDNKNKAARQLYESLGFTYSGSNPFLASNFCPRILIPFSRRLEGK